MAALASALLLGACGDSPPVSIFPLVSKEELALGEAVYNSNCRICHGSPEKGNLPVFKPLKNSALVRGDPVDLVGYILYARKHRDGKTGQYLFEGMENGQVALVSNYMRDAAGKTDLPVRTKAVERARELQSLKAPPPPPPKAKEEQSPAAPSAR